MSTIETVVSVKALTSNYTNSNLNSELNTDTYSENDSYSVNTEFVDYLKVKTVALDFCLKSIDKIINNAIFDEDATDMVVVRDVEFFSLCEHHLIPFFGRAHVAYLPNGKVVGLSKIPRIIDMFSRRLQVQERLTRQIAETVKEILDPIGVAVIMEGQHMCMQMRGVEKQNSLTTTSSMLGKFRESDRTRAEFLSIIGLNR